MTPLDRWTRQRPRAAVRRPASDEVTVSVVGSTGSIGTQTLEVVAEDPDRFRVVALGAQRSVDLLVGPGPGRPARGGGHRRRLARP